MRVDKQFFYAHLGDLAVEQVADVGLIVIKKHGKFGLGLSLLPDPLQQGAQDSGLDFERHSLRRRKVQIIKDIGLSHMTASIDFV